MSRYGPAGRALRSPLNPLWMAGQPLRAAGTAMAGTMPAASQFGDQMVDQMAPEISNLAGAGVDKLLGSSAAFGPGPDMSKIKDAVMQAAPGAAKAAGRVGWAGAAGMLGGAGDILSLEDPSASIGNAGRAALLSMPGRSGGGAAAAKPLPPPTDSPEAGIEALLGRSHPAMGGGDPFFPGQVAPPMPQAPATPGVSSTTGKTMVKATDFQSLPDTVKTDGSRITAGNGVGEGGAPPPRPLGPMPNTAAWGQGMGIGSPSEYDATRSQTNFPPTLNQGARDMAGVSLPPMGYFGAPGPMLPQAPARGVVPPLQNSALGSQSELDAENRRQRFLRMSGAMNGGR